LLLFSLQKKKRTISLSCDPEPLAMPKQAAGRMVLASPCAKIGAKLVLAQLHGQQVCATCGVFNR
jgi:hypothetical protein